MCVVYIIFSRHFGVPQRKQFLFCESAGGFQFQSNSIVVVGYHILCGDRRTRERQVFWRAIDVQKAARGKFECQGSKELDRNGKENCCELRNPLCRIVGS